MENDDFKKLKERIIREKDTFDVGDAARSAGLTTTVYYTAMKKDSFRDLTPGELKFIEEVVRVIKDRRERIEALNNEV
jgi:hypothetical protein